jgi:endo-alpha-1,4-polygalactosaminidase (GH114 family)
MLKMAIRQAATAEERDGLLAHIEQYEAEQKQLRKQAQALENEATAILNAAYDLKAVNPSATGTRDQRTPDELLNIIEEAQQAITAGIERPRSARDMAVQREL